MATTFFRLLVVLMFITTTRAFSQTDSLIFAEGNIVNAETKEPVAARITYQSLPYGNRMGVINSSTFSFPMFDGEKYSISVEAIGFETARYTLDPSTANPQKKVVQDIALVSIKNKDNSVGKVMVLNNLIFQVGKAKISPESNTELDLVVDMMKKHHGMVIQLEGHTDYQGDPVQNMKLSQDRVDAVKKYIVSKGINKKRVLTKAFGGTLPLSQEDTPEAHRMNRRVELRILKN